MLIFWLYIFIQCIFKFKPTYLGEEIPVDGNGDITNDAPRLQINIVDHSDLEGALYDEKN